MVSPDLIIYLYLGLSFTKPMFFVMIVLSKRFITGCLLAMSLQATAQTTSVYDQHEAFAPFFYPAYGDEIRTADGTPGPNACQLYQMAVFTGS